MVKPTLVTLVVPQATDSPFVGDLINVQWTVDRGDDFGDFYVDGVHQASAHSGSIGYTYGASGNHDYTIVVHGETAFVTVTVSDHIPTTCTLSDPGTQVDGVPFTLFWSVDQGSDYADIYVDGTFNQSGSSGTNSLTLGAGSYSIWVVTQVGSVNSNAVTVTVNAPSAAFVQATSIYPGFPSSGGSVAFGADNVSGNSIIVWIQDYAAGVIGDPTVSDSLGNTYSKSLGNYDGSVTNQWLYVSNGITNGPNTITVAAGSGSSSDLGFHISEWSHLGSLTDSRSGTGSGVDYSTPNLTAGSNGVIVAFGGNEVTGGSGAAGSGYTQMSIEAGHFSQAEYQLVTPGVYPVTMTGSSANWQMLSALFN